MIRAHTCPRALGPRVYAMPYDYTALNFLPCNLYKLHGYAVCKTYKPNDFKYLQVGTPTALWIFEIFETGN